MKNEMLRFFRSSSSIVIITILLIGVLTWFHVLNESENIFSEKYGTFMFRALNGWLIDLPIPELHVWFGLILFLLTTVLLVYMNVQLHLIEKALYLPALCYVLLIGGVSEIHLFNPAMVAAILLVVGFAPLLKSFESEQLSYCFFTAPVFISTAAFFYQYAYMYMLVVWFTIALLRPGYWREWVFSILGYALPLFLTFSWFFLVEDDYSRLGLFFNEIVTIQRITPSLSIPNIIFFASSITAVIIAFGHIPRYLESKKMIVRNRYYVVILITIVSGGIVFAVPDMIPFAWYLLALPLSFILSGYLAATKSKRWGVIVLSILFAGVVAAQVIFLI